MANRPESVKHGLHSAYDFAAARGHIYEGIDALDDELRDINRTIHENPELCYQEFKAHDALTNILSAHGIQPTRQAYGLETSFEAEYGSGGRLITYCAEYDALPDIGHACGHNLIATASLASFFGVVAALRESKMPGRVRLLGTPAEEGGGGKIKLIEAGAFKDVDAALMIHPTMPFPDGSQGVANPLCLASVGFAGVFKGKAAHAGGNPWLGVNALDAATLAYTAVSMLRQQVKPGHGIAAVIKGNDSVTGIIPDTAAMQCRIRCETIREAELLKERVMKCFEGAAIATGCTIEFDFNTPSPAELWPNETLCKEFTAAMAELGSHFTCDFENPNRGSWGTDMGNVSHVIPSFHGSFAIPICPGENIHGAGFTRAAATAEAHDLTVDVAKGMAVVGWKFLVDEEVSKAAKINFKSDRLRA